MMEKANGNTTATEEEEGEEEQLVRLDTLFLFQTASGEVSKSHLDARQLCKIVASGNGVGMINGTTNLLLRNPDGSYAKHWKPLHQTPILREACAMWYTCSENDNATGPAVSCRDLIRISQMVKFYSSAVTNSQWKTLEELPSLALALEALQDSNDLQKQQALQDLQERKQDENHDDGDELESFLESTQSEHDKEGDESKQARKPATNNSQKRHAPPGEEATKRKQKKAKFSSRKNRCWIYVSGLPLDCTEAEIAERFAKAGVLDLDPETFKPKIKLYRDKKTNEFKGDASICFARPESVELAITLFDGLSLRLGEQTPELSVQRAEFKQHGDYKDNKKHISSAKRKVVKLAAIQAMDWDEGEFNGRLTGGRKGLRIIVLKHVFDPSQFQPDTEDKELAKIEKRTRTECQEFGTVEKITLFSTNPEGVVVVKFKQPGAASEAVKQYNGKSTGNGSIEASFWDGVTDYTVRDEKKEAENQEKRIEEFGDWLEEQDLPDELKPQVE